MRSTTSIYPPFVSMMTARRSSLRNFLGARRLSISARIRHQDQIEWGLSEREHRPLGVRPSGDCTHRVLCGSDRQSSAFGAFTALLAPPTLGRLLSNCATALRGQYFRPSFPTLQTAAPSEFGGWRFNWQHFASLPPR